MHPVGKPHFVFNEREDEGPFLVARREDMAYSAGQVEIYGATDRVIASSLPTHRNVVCINEGSYAQFVCDCNYDSGWHLVQTAIDNMATHRTLVGMAEQLKVQWKDSELSVGGLQ